MKFNIMQKYFNIARDKIVADDPREVRHARRLSSAPRWIHEFMTQGWTMNVAQQYGTVLSDIYFHAIKPV